MVDMGLEPVCLATEPSCMFLSFLARHPSVTGFCVLWGLSHVASVFRVRTVSHGPLVLAQRPGGGSFHACLQSSCGFAACRALCSSPAQHPFPQPPPGCRHEAQVRPIRALNPAGHSDWLKDGHKLQARPIRASLEYFAIVTAEDTCLLFGAGSVRTMEPGAATGKLILPPGDSLHQNAMQMLKRVLQAKI